MHALTVLYVNDPKMHNYKDNAKFHSTFLVMTLSYATRYQRKPGVIANVKYLGEFGVFQKC
jgi:hypothetical protein